jgi:hypothetical protein
MSNSKIKRGQIHHLPAERGNYTLCGLRIRTSRLATKSFADDEEESSESGSLCKHCERIEKQDS